MDATALAKELGKSPQTIYARARVLGIKGTTVKADGGNGRPKQVFSPEECEAIKNYGTQSTAPSNYSEDLENLEGEAVGATAGVLASVVSNPIGSQLATVNQHLEAFEDLASEALANRVNQVPSRILLKTAARLKTMDALPIAEVILGLNSTPMALAPRKIDPSFI